MKSKELKAFATGYANGIAVNPTPAGTLEITENDTYDVSTYAEAEVNVPNPSTGTLTITENDTYDVTDYAEAEVNVSLPKNKLYLETDSFSSNAGRSGQPDGNTWACAAVPLLYYQMQSYIPSLHITGYTRPSYLPSGWYRAIELDAIGIDDVTIDEQFWTDLYADSEQPYLRVSYFRGPFTSLSFPQTIYIGNYAFYSCSSLSTISLPVCTSIGNYAFQSCTSLSTISLPACTSIGTQTFYNCSSLSTISLPVCTSIGNYAFESCTSLSTISLPVCTSIGNYAFRDCSSLTAVYFGTTATSIASTAFNSCSNLTDIYVPWSEGEVANAPWGATNATIHYDYTGA